MPRYVAFLRAINVGGHIVKMDRLRALFEDIGFAEVETFIASGNVLFSSPSKSAATLEARIEKHLYASLGYAVGTFVRGTSELEGIVANHPYGDDLTAGHTVYVGLLKAPVGDAARKALIAKRTDVDEFHVHEREAYWLCRVKSMDSVHSGASIEKTVAAPATWRNMNTIRRLAEKVAKSRG